MHTHKEEHGIPVGIVLIMQQCKTTVQYGCILLLLFSNSKLDNNLYSTMVRPFCRQGSWQG